MSKTDAAANPRHYKYYDLLMAGFVTVLLCSNMIGPGKVSELHLPLIGAVVFGAGNIFFPISYIFGDVLTEVYGYARARKVIWAGFASMIFYVVMAAVVLRLPVYEKEDFNKTYQPALEIVFGPGWRIVSASILGFWIGDFVNSFVLARLKLLTAGRFLWMRTICSTICGQGVDSLVFYPLAFLGVWRGEDSMWKVMVFNWLFKVGVEVVFTPLTYVIVGWLKKTEGEDYYDRNTNFTPFSLSD